MKNLKAQKNRGVLTIELLIAFAILLINITGIVLLTHGEQTLTVDAKTTTDALALAQQKIEEAKADAKEDFDALATEPTEVVDLYDVDLGILQITECVKQITSKVSWNNFTKSREIELNTKVTHLADIHLFGGECDLGPNDDWDNPGSLVGQPLGGQGATAIEILDSYVYLTSNPSPLATHDFYIYKFEPNPPIIFPLAGDPSPAELVFQSSMNFKSTPPDPDNPEISGLNDVDVAEINGKVYAFLMNDNDTNLAVDPVNDPPIYQQLIVVDVTDPQDPEEITRVSLPGVGNSFPEGRVVHYYNEKLYIGTWETAGDEFHIFDASNPENPGPAGSLQLNHSVRDIIVRDGYAYLATTDNNHELMVIDISDPSSLEHPDASGFGYNTPGNFDGSAVYVLDDRVYLGKEQNNHNPQADDFFVLDRSAVIDGDTSSGLIASREVTTQNNALITGVIVRGNIAFISLDGSTEGLSVINLNTMQPVSNCTDYNFPENNTSMDMESDFLFLSNRSNDEIRVIYDQPEVCGS